MRAPSGDQRPLTTEAAADLVLEPGLRKAGYRMWVCCYG